MSSSDDSGLDFEPKDSQNRTIRRATIGFLVVLGLGTAAWAGGWFWYRSELRGMLDAEEARLAASGGAVRYDQRVIGGFPLAYEVEYQGLVVTTPGGQGEISMPWLRGSAGISDIDTVRFDIPETVRFRYKGAGIQTMGFEMRSKDAVAILRQGDTVAQDITAERLSFVQAGQGPFGSFEMSFEPFIFASTINDGGERGNFTLTSGLAGLSYAMMAGGQMNRSSSSYVNLSITGMGDLDEEPDAFVQGGADGRLSFDVKSFVSEGLSATQGMPPVHYTVAGGRNHGTIGLKDGILSVTSAIEGADIGADFSAFGLPLTDAGLTVETARSELVLPLSAVPETREARLTLSLGNMLIDEPLLAAIDPGQVLPRDPAAFDLAMKGQMRWLRDVTNFARMPPAPGERPVELTSLDLETLDVSLAGARIEAQGAGTMNAETGVPDGEVSLTVTGMQALLENLAAIGLIGPNDAMMAQGLAGIYAVPGETPDTLTSRIEMRDGGVFVNGAQVQ